ncbi:MAG: hypothetical protein N2259_02820 [Patescibacteria group bacterium]|nr:hypothetical protein [Patescibacteria group bacterium]
MVEVKRKSNEPISAMLRRFTEILKKEKKLERAKEIRFKQKPKSKERIKKEALLRKARQAQREYFKKLGILK